MVKMGDLLELLGAELQNIIWVGIIEEHVVKMGELLELLSVEGQSIIWGGIIGEHVVKMGELLELLSVEGQSIIWGGIIREHLVKMGELLELLGAELQSIKAPQSMFFPRCQRSSCTPIQNNQQKYNLVYFNPHVYRQQVGRPKTLSQMAAHILCI